MVSCDSTQIPWLFLAVIGVRSCLSSACCSLTCMRDQGLLGHLLLRLNVAIAVYRKNSVLNEMPIMEVVGATAITAAVSYLVVFLRYDTVLAPVRLWVLTFIECNHQNLSPTSFKNAILRVVTFMGYATRRLCGRTCSCFCSPLLSRLGSRLGRSA